MTTTQDQAAPGRAGPGAPPPDVEIVIPLYNEERSLAASGPAARLPRRRRQIAAWVAQHYTASTVDGVTVSDLTAPGTSAS